jgi:hypothetical protein
LSRHFKGEEDISHAEPPSFKVNPEGNSGMASSRQIRRRFSHLAREVAKFAKLEQILREAAFLSPAFRLFFAQARLLLHPISRLCLSWLIPRSLAGILHF